MRTTLTTLFVLLMAAPLGAQDQDSSRTAPADSGNAVLLDITIDPAANERHVVFLQKGIVYRARFSESGATLRMRSLGNKQLPFIVDLGGGDVSGGTELEIYPQSDGDIELAVLLPASVPVRFRLWSDARATERGRRSAEEGYWEIGVDGLVGWHGDQRPDGGAGTAFGAGMTFGGCLSVRNGVGPLGFLNGCIAGAEGWTAGGADGLLVLFTEPQIRLSNGRRTTAGHRLEWGLVTRFAIGTNGNEGGNFGNTLLGFGAFLARDSRDLNGRGWRFSLVGRVDGPEQIPILRLGIGKYH